MASPPDKFSPATCSIGIVTYLGRFETYFQPLVKRLSFLFPDYDINVFINGHHDIVKQTRYLREVTAFLGNYPRVRYLTHVEHQPLARGWNWLILMSTRPRVLIFNDDVYCDLEVRYNLENLTEIPEVFTLNGSWSHFVINKKVISQVGWFDERFLGIGWEDGDMICRLALHEIPLGNIIIHGLRNYVASPVDAGWAKQSEVTHGKYSSINLEVFKKKWWHSLWNPGPIEGSFKVSYLGNEWTVAPNDELERMPFYYPLSCLKMIDKPLSGTVFVASYPVRALSFVCASLSRIRRKLGILIRGLRESLGKGGGTC
jgi:hypothetical protein